MRPASTPMIVDANTDGLKSCVADDPAARSRLRSDEGALVWSEGRGGTVPGMARWRVDRGQTVDTTPGQDTEYAYKAYLEDTAGGGEAELTIEWVDGAMGSESAARSVAGRYLEGVDRERPARRLIVARDGIFSIAES